MSENHQSPSIGSDLTLIEIISILVASGRRIAILAVLSAVLVAGWTLASPRYFTVYTQIAPVSGQAPAGRLASLAAQFGVGGMLPSGGESPEYLVDVILSREMIASLVDQQYSASIPGSWWHGTDGTSEVAGSLVTFYGYDTSTASLAKNRDKAMRNLRQDLSAQTRIESGVVSVSLRMRSPQLAEAVLSQLLANLETHHRERRQSFASEERSFVEERLALARSELGIAETSLASFLDSNRSFEGSPSLQFEHARLSREVTLRHDVVRSLAQTLEQARIEEVRATPTYSVVSRPQAPAMPDRRYGLIKVLGATFFGLLVGIFGALVGSLLKKEQQENPDLAKDWLALRVGVRASVNPFARTSRRLLPWSRKLG